MSAQNEAKHRSETPSDEMTFVADIDTPPEKARSDISEISTLATRSRAYPSDHGPITDAFLSFFSIRGKHKDSEALDDIATQPSVYDGEQAKHYQPRDDWENIEAFDPSFRWTWREEIKAIRKVDWKVLSWVCVMFFALGKSPTWHMRLVADCSQTSIDRISRMLLPTIF
jgi:hypothetical protein